MSLGWCAARDLPGAALSESLRKQELLQMRGRGIHAFLSGRRQPLLPSLDKMTRESWPRRALARSAMPASLPPMSVPTSSSPLAFNSLARSL